MFDVSIRSQGMKRRGAAAVFTAVASVILVGFAALAIDVGMLNATRAEMQRTADAAALAGAAKLLNQDQIRGIPLGTAEIDAARHEAERLALLNPVGGISPALNPADIVVGQLTNPDDLHEAISLTDPAAFNTVQVKVRRDATANGPVRLWFAQVLGFGTVDLSATATATMKDGIAVGYKVTTKTGNADLLPLALHIDAWNSLLAHTGVTTDNYTFDPDTGQITSGADGITELNLYPGSGAEQLPPGNFGTVNIGPSNNSTSHLSHQIRYGVTAEDLAIFGGELKLGADGTLLLNGDTGLSAAIKDDLEAVKGLPRAIPLFKKVTGNGNNAMYTVVGFGGIRIMNVKLTGSMQSKRVVVQPAFVIDDAVITSTTATSPSYFVYQPVRLVR